MAPEVIRVWYFIHRGKVMLTKSKKMFLVFCLMLVFGVFAGQALRCVAEDAPPPEGGVLPDFSLPIPEKPEERQYLGLDGQGTFAVPKIRAEVVIVEIFSMYCPYCQKEAPNVKALYGMIDRNEDLRKRIKMIGVGAGNSPFEVDTYKNAYGMVFPHFADPDFAVHNALGKVRTPYFIVIKINQDGSHKVIYSKLGAIGDPHDFLELITKESALKKGT
jgi:thiol-disulfide isomerase/thioredoxin